MDLFKLNKLYILESIPDRECNTAKILYTSLKENFDKGDYHGIKDIVLVTINSRKEWDDIIVAIRKDILENRIFPYIHIEMHSEGNMGKNGLLIKNDELLTWSDFFTHLQNLNYCTHNYLFLTMGVCHGLNISFYLKIYDRSPFYGAVGSFFELLNIDLLVQYALFYDEILKSSDVNKAMEELMKDNPRLKFHSDYNLIDSVGLFKKVYLGYLKEKCSRQGIENRIIRTFSEFLRKIGCQFPTRGIRRHFRHRFLRILRKTKDREYRRACERFLMTDVFVENIDRFKLPDNVYDFKRMDSVS